MKYGYLTFDCYGTLIDWKTGIEKALAAASGSAPNGGQGLLDAYLKEEKKEEATYKRYSEVLGNSFTALSASLGLDVAKGAATEFARSLPSWPVFPDSAEFLREMGSRGYKRYILSNVDNDLLEETMSRNGLEIDGFVTAEEIGSYKPAHAHWEEFLRRTGAPKETVLHVAQSIYHDIIPAEELGVPSVWVNRYNERLPPHANPVMIVDCLESLRAALE